MNERAAKIDAVKQCYISSLEDGLSDEQAENQVRFAAQNNPGYDTEVINAGLERARLSVRGQPAPKGWDCV